MKIIPLIGNGFVLILSLYTLTLAGVQAEEIIWENPEFFWTSDSTTGSISDLETDIQGDFHLAVSRRSDTSIWYGKRESGSWTSPDSVVAVMSEWPTFCFDMEFWGSYPTIVYRDAAGPAVKFTIKTGDWSEPDSIPNTEEVGRVKFVIATGGTYHLFETRDIGSGNYRLFYQYNVGTNWYSEYIAEVSSGVFTQKFDICLDSNNDPHFVWYNYDLGSLFYARRTGIGEYDIQVAASLSSCGFLELGMVNPDLPYIGY